jgi:hypothetical protein
MGWFGQLGLIGCVSLAGSLLSPLAQYAHAQHVTVAAEGTCLVDDQIDEPTRDAVDLAAVKFLDALQGNAPGSAEPMVAQGARAKLSADSLAAMGPRFAAMMKGSPTVSHTYFVKIAVQTKSVDTADCQPVARAPVTETWDKVETINVPEQAHVLLASVPGPTQATVALWLVPEDGGWKVNGFWANYTRLEGMSGDQAWASAKRERAAGHTAEAAHWYAVANQLLYLGPYFKTGTGRDFEQDARSFVASLNAQPRATPAT